MAVLTELVSIFQAKHVFIKLRKYVLKLFNLSSVNYHSPHSICDGDKQTDNVVVQPWQKSQVLLDKVRVSRKWTGNGNLLFIRLPGEKKKPGNKGKQMQPPCLRTSELELDFCFWV